jgi:hypothetical protein
VDSILRKSLLVGLIVGILIGSVVGYYLPRIPSYTVNDDDVPPSDGHYDLYDEIYEIKNRMLINITDPEFPETGIPECIWYELREEDADEFNQTTVNFWVFQDGKGLHGDIEAFVEIYNVENSKDMFTIEITRNCWFELTAYYNGEPFVVFPKVNGNELSYGYMTYTVAL